jgi:hypothetical protein
MSAGLVSPAGAKPKPITQTFQATAAAPDPTNWAGQAGAQVYSVCQGTVPPSQYKLDFTAPAAGKLVVDLSNFKGDWDLLLTDKSGKELTYGGASDLGTTSSVSEKMTYKFKKKMDAVIIACNWVGGPTADGKYTFTFA